MHNSHRKNSPCPICRKRTNTDPASNSHAPFCSRGCKDKDLLQWFGEGYRIAGPPAIDPDADAN